MSKQTVTVLITDLDNTLFDWVESWYASFSAMLDEVARISAIPKSKLITEIKVLHEKHGTSEYALLLEEIPSLAETLGPGEKVTEKYATAIDAFRAARRSSLRLYPSVLETLRTMKEGGAKIVGYTESMAYYSAYRMRKLGLDHVLDVLYSPPDHDFPKGLSPAQLRTYPPERYVLAKTIHRHTPAGEIKPNPAILLSILDDMNVAPSDCIYVGDSLMKDIEMAKKAGVKAVHAKYGEAHSREQYELLRAVTHWPAHQVSRETNASFEKPDLVLEDSFAELLAHFQFESAVAADVGASEMLERTMQAWERTVEVQQHFNELCVKIRGLAVTVLAAILTAAAFSLKEALIVRLLERPFSLALPILIAGLFVWAAFWIMDRHWYHRFLRGAVLHALKLEKDLSAQIPNIGLSQTIGEESRKPFKILFFKVPIDSASRLDVFYGVGAAVLVVFLGVLWFGTKPLPQRAVSPLSSVTTEAIPAKDKPAGTSAPAPAQLPTLPPRVGSGLSQ